MSLSNEKTEVAGSGDLAYRRGTFKITYTNPQTKQAENGAGTYLTVFRKQADGSWKVVADFECSAASPDELGGRQRSG